MASKIGVRPAWFATPEARANYQRNTGQVFSISKKMHQWALDNGYSELMIGLSQFCDTYKAAQRGPGAYARYSPEELEHILLKTRRRLDGALRAYQQLVK